MIDEIKIWIRFVLWKNESKKLWNQIHMLLKLKDKETQEEEEEEEEKEEKELLCEGVN